MNHGFDESDTKACGDGAEDCDDDVAIDLDVVAG